MIKLGLIGKSIAHSKSQEIYEKILEQKITYKLFDFDNEEDLLNLEDYFREVDGISITAPYKKNYANQVDIQGDVANLGIINCIRKKDSKYEATNTDYLAVKDYLKSFDSDQYEIILLGDGSMAEITLFALKILGLSCTQMSRSKTEGFIELDLTKIKSSTSKDLLVINSCARSYTYNGPITSGITFWDFNYGHQEHIKRLKKSSILYIDGMDLLKDQAKYALRFWGINY